MQSAGFIIPDRPKSFMTENGDYSAQMNASRRQTPELLSHARISKHLEGSYGGSFPNERSKPGRLGTADSGHKIKYLLSHSLH